MFRTKPASRRPRVVIVGGGFGGLAAARALASSPVDITLVDRRNYHLFQPLLYQVATAALSPADIAWPIRALLRRQRNARVVMGRVTGVDRISRELRLEEGGRIGYDYLVLATGARRAYFGHPEWEAAAPGLKTIDDATELRRRVLLALEQAERIDDPIERASLMTFVVVGAGPTGVEMAGALAELLRGMAGEFRRIDMKRARVILVEAGERVLPSFSPRLSQAAKEAIERIGVQVQLGVPVTDCTAEGVALAGAPLQARTIVWAAGVVASPAAKWLHAPRDRAGRVLVEPDLSAPGAPEIFVIGDAAAVGDGVGRFVPGVAPAAKQMGAHVGRTIARRVAGRRGVRRFRYRDLGAMATIGRGAAVAEILGVGFSGTPAWLLWALAHVYGLIGARSRLAVASSWAWSFVTGARAARLAVGGEPAAPLRLEPPRRERGLISPPPRIAFNGAVTASVSASGASGRAACAIDAR